MRSTFLIAVLILCLDVLCPLLLAQETVTRRYEELKQPRSKPLLLKDIRKKLIFAKDTLQPEIIEHFKSFPVQKQTDKRILACIIGVA